MLRGLEEGEELRGVDARLLVEVGGLAPVVAVQADELLLDMRLEGCFIVW